METRSAGLPGVTCDDLAMLVTPNLDYPQDNCRNGVGGEGRKGGKGRSGVGSGLGRGCRKVPQQPITSERWVL